MSVTLNQALTNATYTATSSPEAEPRGLIARLSGEISFEDVLTDAERAAVHAGTATFDAAVRLEQLINDTSGFSVSGQFSAGRVIRLPHGKLRFMTTCNIKHQVRIIGEGRGDNANVASTIISCDQGVEGFVVNDRFTYGAALDDGTYGATNAIETSLEGFLLRSEETWDGTVASRYGLINGIRVRTKCNLRDIHVYNFPGAGIHQYTAASTAFADRLGNSNYSWFEKIKLTGNLIGWYVAGGDANVVRVGLIDLRDNKMWGILTSCLLGNHIGTVHAANNGTSFISSVWHDYGRWLFRGGTAGPMGMLGTINAVGGNSEPGATATHWQMGLPDDSSYSGNWDSGTAYTVPTFLFHSSKRWRLIQNAAAGVEPGADGGVYWEDHGILDAADGWTATFKKYEPGVTTGTKRKYNGMRWTGTSTTCTANFPGFDDSNWEFRGFQTRANVFMPAWDVAATYYPGGAYCNLEATAQNVIESLYIEADQRIVTGSKDRISGGIFGLPGPVPASQSGFLQQGKGWVSQMEATHPQGFGTVMFNGPDTWMRWYYSNDHAQGIGIIQDTSEHSLRMQHGGSLDFWRATQTNTTVTFGRASSVGGGNFHVRKLFVGATAANARQIDFASAAPTTGEAARGDFVFNINPTATNSIFGWRCITGGTNGSTSVWQAVYISPSAL